MTKRRFEQVSYGAFTMALCFAMAAPALAQDESGPTQAAATKTATVKNATLQAIPDISVREQRINKLIKEAFQHTNKNSGVWAMLKGRSLIEIDPRALALSAITKNLSIQRAHISKEITDAAIEEARALFDPVLNVSFNYSNRADYQRVENVLKYKPGTVSATATTSSGSAVPYAGGYGTLVKSGINTVGVNGTPACPDVAGVTCAQPHNLIFFDTGLVRYIGYNKPRAAGYYADTVTAHTSNPYGVNETYTADMTVTQQLPWGVAYSLDYQTVYHEADYINNAGSPFQTTGNYHMPWTSTVTVKLQTPLPWTKNFGRDAAQADVSNRVARLQDDQAVWTVKAVINSTLLNVDIAYWELVKAADRLYAAVENEKAVRKLLAKTQRLYDLREATEYSKVQVQSELERVKGEVETAKTAYIQASDALLPLLDVQGKAVYLPKDYTMALSKPIEIDPAKVKADMVKLNPLLKSQDYNVTVANVLLKQSDLLRRPDISFSGSLVDAQINSVFGYGSWLESLRHVATAEPDGEARTYQITFTRPWNNRAAEAGYQQAQASLNSAQLSVDSTRDSVGRLLADAAVDLVSAHARIDITRRNMELATTTYNKAVAQQQSRDVTEYEIIQQSRNVLTATQQWIQAVIDAKEAESNWLAAKGELPARYAEMTAQTIVDKGRVKALAASKLVPLYSAEKTNAK